MTAQPAPVTPEAGDVAALTEAERASLKAAAMKSIGCDGHGSHGWISGRLLDAVECIVAAHLAAALAPAIERARGEALREGWFDGVEDCVERHATGDLISNRHRTTGAGS